jgi:hypothetical protein
MIQQPSIRPEGAYSLPDYVTSTLPLGVDAPILAAPRRRFDQQNPLFYGVFRRSNETPPVSMDLAGSHAEWLIVSYLSYAPYD